MQAANSQSLPGVPQLEQNLYLESGLRRRFDLVSASVSTVQRDLVAREACIELEHVDERRLRDHRDLLVLDRLEHRDITGMRDVLMNVPSADCVPVSRDRKTQVRGGE